MENKVWRLGATAIVIGVITLGAPRLAHAETNGAMIGGGVLFGLGYLPAAGVGLGGGSGGGCDSAYFTYLVPAVGPLVGAPMLTGCNENYNNPVHWTFAVGSSLLQIGGITLFVVGAKRRTAANSKKTADRKNIDESLVVIPNVSMGSIGLSAVGTF